MTFTAIIRQLNALFDDRVGGEYGRSRVMKHNVFRTTINATDLSPAALLRARTPTRRTGTRRFEKSGRSSGTSGDTGEIGITSDGRTRVAEKTVCSIARTETFDPRPRASRVSADSDESFAGVRPKYDDETAIKIDVACRGRDSVTSGRLVSRLGKLLRRGLGVGFRAGVASGNVGLYDRPYSSSRLYARQNRRLLPVIATESYCIVGRIKKKKKKLRVHNTVRTEEIFRKRNYAEGM